MYIKLIRGKIFWHYVIKKRNHQVIATSETYYSRNNARRAAFKLADELNINVVET